MVVSAKKDTSRLDFSPHKLTFCVLIFERFVVKGVCSGRDYVLPLNGASRSWELIIRCVLREKIHISRNLLS